LTQRQSMKKVICDFEIYPYQIDFIGHVSNIVYIQWMEIVRCKLLEEIGLPVHEIAEQGFVPVLVHTEIDYKQPLYLGETVHVKMWLTELKNASAIMKFYFYKELDSLVAEGLQKGLFMDKTTLRPKKLTSEQRDLFSPYLYPDANDKSLPG
jgi:acyl-CoA thioester hydrolase